MKITKFVHACVLVEDGAEVGLFDPGAFSADSLNLDKIPKLTRVMITHEHPDHYDETLVKTIATKFPEAKFYTTDSIVSKLQALGINNATSQSDEVVEVEELAHESMSPLAPDPNVPNVAIHFNKKVSHPGDSHHLNKTYDVLLVPFAGPWGATIEGVRMAVNLKPKTVVPIHDWMWNKDWQSSMYGRFAEFFPSQGIEFISTVGGQGVEL